MFEKNSFGICISDLIKNKFIIYRVSHLEWEQMKILIKNKIPGKLLFLELMDRIRLKLAAVLLQITTILVPVFFMFLND